MIGQLGQLRILSLAGNQLSSLPESLRQLTWLQELYLHDNAGLGLPREVLGPKQFEGTPARPSKILEYYRTTS